MADVAPVTREGLILTLASSIATKEGKRFIGPNYGNFDRTYLLSLVREVSAAVDGETE